jgi:hypothetical protein
VKTLAILLAALALAAPALLAQESYGTIRATTKLRPDGSKSTTIVDPDAHTAEETIQDAANRVMKKTTYLLGDRDLAVGAIFYDAKGKIIYKASYRRDEVGHVVEASFTGAADQYLGKRVFVYTGGGNSATDAATQVIDYDANGQMIAQAQPVSPSKSSKKRH